MGAVSTNFGIQYNMECGVASAAVSNFEPATGSDIPLDHCVSALVALKIRDIVDSKIMLLMPTDLAKSISEKAASKKEAPKANAQTNGAAASDSSGDLLSGPQMGSFESAPLTQSPAGGFQSAGAVPGNINMLLDVQLHVAIELGRTEMSIKRSRLYYRT
jgi:flagellar motor switch/type III secretory pathway protein FliN